MILNALKVTNIYTQTFVMDVCCCDVAVIKFCINKGSGSLIREYCSCFWTHVFTKWQQAIKMLISFDLSV